MSDSKDKKLSKQDFKDKLTEGYEKNAYIQNIESENRTMKALINNKKMKNQVDEIDRLNRIQEDLEKEDLLNRKFDPKKMRKDFEDRKKPVTFLNKTISKDIIAAPGSLIVIPSMTNNGKSTLTAHIAEAVIKEGKSVLILSNEEKEQDVRARISCLRTGISFGDYKTNKCSDDQFDTVLSDAEELSDTNKLVVISTDTEEDAYKVTTVKGIMTTLEKAKGHFDMVIIDYYTNVNRSEVGVQEPWSINNNLASELNIFKDSCPFPLIVFAQCEALKSDKKVDHKSQKDYESNHPRYRWIGGRSILLYATDIIELEKDFNNSCSILFAHKVRFAHGDLIPMKVLPFDKKMQRFLEKITPEWDAKVMSQKVVEKTKQEIKNNKLDSIFE